ncbi:hypothetical protein ACR9E3_21455 [Actinomycetospora sp. C-140]
MVLLLGPFLVIGAVGAVAAVVTLRVRARGQWSTRPADEVPRPDEPGAPGAADHADHATHPRPPRSPYDH